VDRLPASVVEDAHTAIEAVLLEFAADHDPETLAQHAKALSAVLDQDGAYRDADAGPGERSHARVGATWRASTPVGQPRDFALSTMRPVAEAIADGDSELAGGSWIRCHQKVQTERRPSPTAPAPHSTWLTTG
jgi:hypothetical protein